MKKIIVAVLFIASLSIVLLLSKSPIFRMDRYGGGDIDWVDCVYYNNQLYHLEHVDSDHRIKKTIEENMVDKYLGKVKFTLDNNVSNMHYKMRNWDASFLEKGTKIYSIANIDSNKSIAVLEDGVYVKYSVLGAY
jgi:hypothetical protein